MGVRAMGARKVAVSMKQSALLCTTAAHAMCARLRGDVMPSSCIECRRTDHTTSQGKHAPTNAPCDRTSKSTRTPALFTAHTHTHTHVRRRFARSTTRTSLVHLRTRSRTFLESSAECVRVCAFGCWVLKKFAHIRAGPGRHELHMLVFSRSHFIVISWSCAMWDLIRCGRIVVYKLARFSAYSPNCG